MDIFTVVKRFNTREKCIDLFVDNQIALFGTY